MSSEIAVEVENLGKCYQIYDNPCHRLLQMLALGRKQYFREFWALKHVSFQVRKGESVGIVGRNGSGKSTLLQLICSTLNPTTGSIRTNGRLAALLELGSGFNPEFTGRENVYMNAAIIGLRKEEIDSKYDSIAAFADIGDYIDQPVKFYSSGMVVRLAFAVQAQIDPDILVIDEALAVGDAKFQAKCFDRLRRLKNNGTSILLVTHSGEQIVTHCSTAILLDYGELLESGNPNRIVSRYMDLLFGKEKMARGSLSAGPINDHSTSTAKTKFPLNNSQDVFSSRPGFNSYEYRWGDGAATILDFYIAADNELYPSEVATGQTVVVGISVKFNSDIMRPIFGFRVKTKEGILVSGGNSEMLECTQFRSLFQKGTVMHAEATFKCRLGAGDYFISVSIATRKGEEIRPHDRRYDAIHFAVQHQKGFFGLADLELNFSIVGLS